MASLIRISITIFIFSILAAKGFSKSSCSPTDVLITTTASGREVEGKPEWMVTAFNNCSCAISNVKLSCKGFNTVEKVDPAVFVVRNGNTCILKPRQKVEPFRAVRFSYAWDPPAELLPLSFLLGTCTRRSMH